MQSGVISRPSALRSRTGAAALVLCAAAAMASACAAAPEADEQVSSSEATVLTSDELKGSVIGSGYGFGNRCVTDVAAAFAALPTSPSNRARYWSQGGRRLPPYNAVLAPFAPLQGKPDFSFHIGLPIKFSIPHVQSMSRFEFGDQQDDRWFAVSRSHQASGHAGFFLVHFGDTEGADGSRMLTPGVDYTSPIPRERTTEFYYPIQGGNHPGGLQAFGHYLAVAVEPESGYSFVDVYDFSRGFGAGVPIQRVPMTPSGTNFRPDRSISAVAVTRLKDHRYLMFVLGKDSSRHGWFFVTEGTELPAPWAPLDYFRGYDTSPPSPFGWFREYQNVTMLTDCGTENIYLLATGNDGYTGSFAAGTDYADLFRLEVSPAGISMALAGSRNFNPGDGGYCTFRAAANGYAGKDNRLLFYCHSHHSNSDSGGNPNATLKLVEYAFEGCLKTQVMCGDECCSGGSSCVHGACCAAEKTCGTNCCGGDYECKDASRSLCCARFEQACGDGCCGVNQQCVAGACQDVPPPPPPPPGENCGSVPACSTASDCPSRFNYCNGSGCCAQIR